MAAPLLLRGLPLLRLRLHQHQYRAAAGIFSTPRRPWCTAAEPSRADESLSSTDKSTPAWSAGDPPKYPRWDDPEYRWKDKEAEILKDIEPITSLTKEILHSGRCADTPGTSETLSYVVGKCLGRNEIKASAKLENDTAQ